MAAVSTPRINQVQAFAPPARANRIAEQRG